MTSLMIFLVGMAWGAIGFLAWQVGKMRSRVAVLTRASNRQADLLAAFVQSELAGASNGSEAESLPGSHHVPTGSSPFCAICGIHITEWETKECAPGRLRAIRPQGGLLSQ